MIYGIAVAGFCEERGTDKEKEKNGKNKHKKSGFVL